MRILQIIPALPKGGAERIILDICRELNTRSGYEARLVCFNDKNEYEFLSSTIPYSVIKSKYIPSLKGKEEINVDDLQLFINDFKPDIIHSHLFESEMVLSQIESEGSTFFTHFHDNMKQLNNFKFEGILKKEKYTNLFEKRIVLKSYRRKKPHIIAISKDTFAFVKTILPKKMKVTLLCNAIDLACFNRTNKTDEISRIVMIGSLYDKKGHDLAIKVIHELHQRGKKVYFDILGEGPNRKILQELIDKLELSEYVFLHGNVNQPEEYLKKAFVYLHTAKYEPFGLVLIEAMAVSLPVVCTDAKGNRDLVINGVNGFMHDNRDHMLIADSVQKIMDDANLRDELSEKAFVYSQDFGIKSYVDKLVDLYINERSSSF